MKHVIIGTAGHVDHGKSMLIKSLTGIETDRLREEKERGISIELGFASLTLPSGRRAGIVDVPGHERFIKNMLAGVGGIDLVLLVIAADEGVMPQTKEHFDILQLLQVKAGIVVLTKIDLVDADWLDLVKEEVQDFLAGTTFENAPIIPVSSVTKEGLPELINTIDDLVENVQERPTVGQIRLPIDRVFSVTGFGTVVTGTMISGKLSVGDEIVIMPPAITTRVRGLQVHGKKVESARAGQRVAVNLAGVEVEQIERGNVVSSMGALTPSYRLDTKLHLLKSAERPIRNRTRTRLHIGTDEIMGRVVLLDREELQPGEQAYVQFQLEDKVVAGKGDRFVIRSYSPVHTIGGGTVIDPNPPRHKRFRQEVIAALITKEKGSPEELVEQFLSAQQVPLNTTEISSGLKMPEAETEQAIDILDQNNRVKIIKAEGNKLVLLANRYRYWCQQITDALTDYHKQYSIREGFPKEELRSRMFSGQSTKVFQSVLQTMQQDGIIELNPQTVALPNFTGQPTGKDARYVAKIEELLKSKGFQPPVWKEVVKQLELKQGDAQEYLAYLMRVERVHKITDDMYWHAETVNAAKNKIIGFLRENKTISVGETRDLLQTSRKYALPILEYFDQQRITRRVEDNRVLSVKAKL
ncbi:selenocysteine-specific translation elongation factor [Desulfofalx alkaliphila]|uniref:selenocysteine-specific translation elongation factor n=1 Tax=Desulfofalx alkaliphila TaxID=105483 RepID=UPI0004E23657|nr:selenocysteine-specific translation elongation factor [Desulfofalx alkaliphila]